MELSAAWKASISSASQEFSHILWNQKCLPQQELSTWPYSEPRHSTPRPHIVFRSVLIQSSRLPLGLPHRHSPLNFPNQETMHFRAPHVCCMPRLSHPPYDNRCSANHEASHHAVFCSAVSCYFLPLLPQVLYLPQHPILEHCGSTCPYERKIKNKRNFSPTWCSFCIQRNQHKNAVIFTDT